MVAESDRQHGDRDNNRQLATAATSTRPFLALSAMEQRRKLRPAELEIKSKAVYVALRMKI
jgi:hypothetical protein